MSRLLRLSGVAAVMLFVSVAYAQPTRTVLVEEFTGTWCQYCPFGADTLEAILSSMNNVVALSYHGGSQTEPFQTTEGNSMYANLPITAWPTAAIDRVVWQTSPGVYSIPLSRSVWRQAVGLRQTNAPTSPVSVEVEGTYDSTFRVMTVVVRVHAYQSLSGDYFLNVVLSEDDLNYPQVEYTPTGNILLDPYYHKHVVRKMTTGAFGVQLTPTGFMYDQVIEKTVSYNLPAGWAIDHVKFTAFVTTHIASGSYGNYRDILQTYQETMRNTLVFTPVELASFRASVRDGAVDLAWRTDAETNNRGWSIERRGDDGTWTAIAFVDGHGTCTGSHEYAYTDRAVHDGLYAYRLRQTDYDGTATYSRAQSVYVRPAPVRTGLRQNFPNPFATATTLAVDLVRDAPLRLEIYDGVGRRVMTLADADFARGTHFFEWNGRDLAGAAVPPGTYYCRMSADGVSDVRQVILAR